MHQLLELLRFMSCALDGACMTRGNPRTPARSTLEMQLSEANARARQHVSAMWQYPLAYLAVVGVALGSDVGIQDQEVSMLRVGVGVGLLIVGVLLMIAMAGWSSATSRAVDLIQQTESDLCLPVTAQHHFATHELPHFLVVVLGMVGALALALSGVSW